MKFTKILVSLPWHDWVNANASRATRAHILHPLKVGMEIRSSCLRCRWVLDPIPDLTSQQ